MSEPEVLNLTSIKRDPKFAERLTPAGHKLYTCVQCGTCTASCPSASAMDITPRQMWHLVQLGMVDEVLRSKAMWMCSICYQCHARCPRGIPLTETIAKLKQLAIQARITEWHESTAFYLAFASVLRRYGRMREVQFMAQYFLSTNPLSALGYAGMGWTLLRRGKLRPEMPKLLGAGRLDRIFDRVAELEGKP